MDTADLLVAMVGLISEFQGFQVADAFRSREHLVHWHPEQAFGIRSHRIARGSHRSLAPEAHRPKIRSIAPQPRGDIRGVAARDCADIRGLRTETGVAAGFGLVAWRQGAGARYARTRIAHVRMALMHGLKRGTVLAGEHDQGQRSTG